ncbi:MAG: ATP-binding cassette domain-containing protein [Planctomycetota bacterium]
MIELKDVHKTFGTFHVLQGLNLRIDAGETLVILGRSGIGKSVSLRHIVGLLRPDSGQVVVFGQDMSTANEEQTRAVRRRVGYLFQDGALLNWLTIGGNMALPLQEVYKLPKAEIAERVEHAAALVELQDALHKFPSEVSGGMRKRAGLARAVVCRPDVILYDEPTSGLDPISSSIINRLINNLKDNSPSLAQIVVTHDMHSAFTIADRIALLHEGQIIAEGSSDEIRNSKDPAVVQFIHGQIDGPLSRTDKPGAVPAKKESNREPA